jgi:hypothetical protein
LLIYSLVVPPLIVVSNERISSSLSLPVSFDGQNPSILFATCSAFYFVLLTAASLTCLDASFLSNEYIPFFEWANVCILWASRHLLKIRLNGEW